MDMDVAAARERVTEATSNWEARLAECHVEPYMTCKTDCRLTVTCVRAHSLTDADKQVLFEIFEDNMRATYEPTWGWDPAVKMKEMFSVNSLYIILQQGDDVVAYSHFQFCLDDDEEPECMVLYCFELQVKSSQQGKGLGGYIMNRLLNISRCWDMQKVMLTVLKKNRNSIRFYKKMGFHIDPASPSCFKEKAFYEILSVDTLKD